MSITAANIVFTFSIDSYSPGAVTIAGYAPDRVIEAEAMQLGEMMKGVDGFATAGWYNTTLVTPFTLMGDSPSNAVLDGWVGAMKALSGGTGDVLYARNAVITFPSLQKKMSATQGLLRNWMPFPPGQRLLQPRPCTIEWGQWQPLTAL